MRTIDWAEQEEFLNALDRIKTRHNIRHDSALAELAGISHTSISNWRNGKSRPSAQAITRIATATDEPSRPLLAVAGLVEGQDDEADPFIGAPETFRRLIALYRSADPDTRERIESGVDLIVTGVEGSIALIELKRFRGDAS